MKTIDKTLKNFALTDGLLKGTALVSNIFTVACIALLPGFGASGIFLANAIQMTIGGLLEFPAGVLADRYGASRALKIALSLKFIVTGAFLGAIMASQRGDTAWLIFFFSMEAIVDAFAGACLNGAYQAAYLQWYRSRLAESGTSPAEAPPLFLESFRFALPVRFLLPFILIPIIHALGSSPYTMAYNCIVTVFALRTIVLLKVSRDLYGLLDARASSIKHTLSFVTGNQGRKWALPLFRYALIVLCNMSATFYFVAEIFRTMKAAAPLGNSPWIRGVGATLVIYLLRTLASAYIFPLLARRNMHRIMQTASVIIAASSAALLFIITVTNSEATVMIVVATYTLILLCGTDAMLRHQDSHLDSYAPPEAQATWLSLASGLGYLLFGLASAAVWIMGFEAHRYFIFCGIVMISTLTVAVSFNEAHELAPRKHRDFASVLKRVFLTSSAFVIGIFLVLDTVHNFRTSFAMQAEKERLLSGMIISSVQDPLVQGSFFEAGKRLKKAQDDGAILCGSIQAWDFNYDLCSESSRASSTSTVRNEIRVSPTAPSSIGSVTLTFDRSTLAGALITRTLLSAAVLALIGLFLFYFLRSVSHRVQKELQEVLRIAASGHSEIAQSFTIKEFQSLSDSLREVISARDSYVKQAALHGMAKQVAHDIRSPLTALELVTTDLAVLPEDIRLIIRNAAQRIKAIANDLLRLSKDTEKPASPQNAAEAKLLPLLLESMMGEKLPRLKGQGCSQLIFTVEPGDNALFVHLPEVPFLRALSNLIDNALDATPQGGTVTMNLSRSGAQALIAITDEGNGIPPEVLNVLGKQPISFGKENGNGLGFFSAHKTIIELGGRIDVASSPCGSTVFITLPIVAAPRWISQKLQVRRGATVVVVDDDPSIHDVWASRFAGAVDLHHYMNATALKGTFSSFNNAA